MTQADTLPPSSAFSSLPEEQAYISIYDRRSPLIDLILVALPFAAILFNKWLGPLTVLTVLAITPLYILLRWERLYTVLARVWPLVLLPAFAMLSVVWSDEPNATLRYGFLYMMTVIPAVLLGAGCTRDALLKGIFLAFALYMFVSIPMGRWVGWGNGGRAFVGLMASKNASGDAAALSLLVTMAMLFWAIHKRNRVFIILALLVLPCGLFSLWASKSTGALIATLIAMSCLLMWVASRQVDRSARTLIFILAVIAVMGLLATINLWMPPLFEYVLESSGKNAGLTGRDKLWRKADELIAQRPWFGGGYSAFWVHDNLDAEYLWRIMGIENRSGFNFHNTPRDILVDLGIVGLGLFVIVFAFSAVRLFMRTMIDPHHVSILFCALIMFESPRVYFELLGFSDMNFATFIIFISLSHAFRPTQLPAIGQLR
jgi:exopolysaccharide production protein ExoQ